MLAGRKLLLADDSITIQKVVDLTFADEGVKVFTVSNGWEAVKKLDEIVPDVVLADVFMPEMTGYELCEYIKQTEKLKHIPVMLLVGSFEPFDEAEARRVGADDILTKPFQSIRKLIEKVGGLVGGQKPEDAPTAELQKTVEVAPEREKLSTEDLELTTADTQQLPRELRSVAQETVQTHAEEMAQVEAPEPETLTQEQAADGYQMEHSLTHSSETVVSEVDSSEVLLDLGEIPDTADPIDEEFVLDIDMDEPIEAEPVVAHAAVGREFVEPKVAEKVAPAFGSIGDRLATTQEFARPGYVSPQLEEPVLQRVTDEPDEREVDTVSIAAPAAGTKITLDQLSPEVIDAIAKRVVQQMSSKVVEEIAWEVVPQLSELMIKRQLEEKKS